VIDPGGILTNPDGTRRLPFHWKRGRPDLAVELESEILTQYREFVEEAGAVYRDDSSQFDTLYQFADLAISAGVFLFALSLPGMLTPAAGEGLTSLRLIELGFCSALSWPAAFTLLDIYRMQRRPRFQEAYRRLGKAFVGAATFQVAAALLIGAPTALLFPLLCSALQLIALASFRLLVRAGSGFFRTSDRYPRNVIIVGSGPRAEYVKQVIEDNPAWMMQIIGFVDNETPPGGARVPVEQIFKLSDMEGLMNDQVIDEVIIACPRSMLATIVPIANACAAAGIPLTLLSDLFGDFLPQPQVTRFGTLPALSFSPVHHNAILLAVKRTIDVAGSLLGLIAIAPVIGISALLIKITSPGPIAFRQVRCGLNGRHFIMLKLRTMTNDAEDRKIELSTQNEMDGPVFKMARDPRITKVGRVLRRYSIDELPQLWNVFRGDMSLVGPRPPVPVEVAEYETFERRRLSMRPGLTCLWQVSGRNTIGFEDWVRLDLEYIDTWSLINDVKILLRTFPAVLSGDGAS